MNINATLINYYHVCHRKLWLHANGIRMEHTSDVVSDGKLLHETSYPQRAEKHSEIELQATEAGLFCTGKIDFYDADKKEIHEVKRSDKVEIAHEWQVKFYIWLLEQNGVQGATARLEYPKLRETRQLTLSDTDRLYLVNDMEQVAALIQQELCPPLLHAKICKSCSYYDFCYSGEV